MNSETINKSVVSDHILDHGESYIAILKYGIPEFFTALLIFALPSFFDTYCILQLRSTDACAALGITNSLWHMFVKLAESFSVAGVIVVGQCNGLQQFRSAGSALKNTFWISLVMGAFFASFLFWGAPYIYRWYGVNAHVQTLGIPYLRLRSLSVFFMFIYCAFIGFLRGIKNTQVPMIITICGTFLFFVLDYTLVIGLPGWHAYGLYGSALASVIQYGAMVIMVACYTIFEPNHRKYGIALCHFSGTRLFVKDIMRLSSWTAIDKLAFSFVYIWLCKMICGMGTDMMATYEVVKSIERFCLLPAIACAQVITTLVSNDYGAGRWDTIMANIRRIMAISLVSVSIFLSVMISYRDTFVTWLGCTGDLKDLVSTALPFFGIFVMFDLIQLILSAALRGAANVQIVMIVRTVILFFYFIPISYFFSILPLSRVIIKFILVYGSLYGGAALMSCIYVWWFSRDRWKKCTVTPGIVDGSQEEYS